MSAHNKVVWSEGLFLQPQHFQQQDRYVERYVESRCHALVPHSWGFTEIEIEQDLLAIGKFGVRRAVGVFPDGSPFRLPDDGPVPLPLEIGPHVRNQPVYLAVPVRRGDALDVDRAGDSDPLARHSVLEWAARDATAASSDAAPLEVSALRTRLLLGHDVTPAYACVPLAEVVECRADRQVVLDGRFMPTVLQVKAALPLATFLDELVGLVHQRAEALGGRVAATSRGGAAEVADFMMLQALNRYEPLLAHLRESARVHPEDLYRTFAAMAGELATFTASKRPPALAPYRHDRLRESFAPVIAAIRTAFSAVGEPRALAIPVESKKFGVHVAQVSDASLFGTAMFVLAVRGDVASEDLRRRFPAQLKVGSVERIRDLVNLGLPGVPVHPLPVAPREIPFYAGFVYFEFDQSHELWASLKNSGGVAMHVAGEFPGLALELWAIRGG